MSAPRTVVSGGTGLVGRFIVERLLAEGHDVMVTGRVRPAPGFFSAPVSFTTDHLNPDEDHAATFADTDYFVHASFNHLPGKYRGGEGGDADGFRRRNIEGTLARFRAAKNAGVRRAAFISSRAVYGDLPGGAELSEESPARPNFLYGEVKLAGETGLAELADQSFQAVSLRVTGVYGSSPPGRAHKWARLVAEHMAGRPVSSRIGTEVHGEDVAWAVQIALTATLEDPHAIFCVSDIAVDNADILSIVNEVAGLSRSLPERADPASLRAMNTNRLKALGWRPGGWPLFEASVRELVLALRTEV
jgi:nucleoside-diphosphate-sugar epimerase